MKLHKEVKQSIVIPVKTNLGYYRCICGNRLVEYRCQEECEICKARFNWDDVEAVATEGKTTSAKGYVNIEYKAGRKKNASKD